MKRHDECSIHLYRIVKRCVLQAVARLTRTLNCSMNLSASRKHFVSLFHVLIAVSQSHGCQAATTCVAGTVGTGSAMTVASHYSHNVSYTLLNILCRIFFLN